MISAGRELNHSPLIDRDKILQLKLEALRGLWSRFNCDQAFDAFLKDRGELLLKFCTFCALADEYGRDWRQWPQQFRHPAASAVRDFAVAAARSIRFYAWVQWLLDEQLGNAARRTRLIQDLPVGFSPSGADAWIWQVCLALEMAVGVPGDRYNPAGQNWGLPPFIPWRLSAANYQPWIDTIRAALRHAGGLRIDHIMGLFRMYWIPAGNPPTQGAFVRYPVEDLLGILALESYRHKATIIGEDLGTLESGTPELLNSQEILSYRLLWFEEADKFPAKSLAAITTHDLPTIAGAWSGQDIRDQAAIGIAANPNNQHFEERLATIVDDRNIPIIEVIHTAHSRLASAPSSLKVATLEDALAWEHRPNVPGVVGPSPNWARALPFTIDEITQQSLPNMIARTMNHR